jgi:hypothetical protein
MIFLSTLNAIAQVMARFLLLVAGYLGIVLGAIVCLLLFELLSERASVMRAYGAAPASPGVETLHARLGHPSRVSYGRSILKISRKVFS